MSQMNMRYVWILFAAATLLPGCSMGQNNLALDPVGPSSHPSTATDGNGKLMVFSAFDVGAPSPGDFSDRRRYTDYKILSADGKLLQVVHNDTRSLLPEPVKVELPPGTYRVVADSNGYGVVTVPVVIVANRVTPLHLEGGGSWSNASAFNPTNAVRLPDGQIIGWRATTETTSAR